MRRIGLSNWIALTGLTVAGVVFAVRLEGRIVASDLKQSVVIAAQEQKHTVLDDHNKATIEQVRQDLQYIRERLDQAIAGDLATGRRR